MKKRILSVLLCIVLCLSLMPTFAFATVTVSYGLWVGGTQVTNDNKNDIFGNGTASFNTDTSTLTLNNATLTESYEYEPYYESVIYSALPSLTVNLTGTNEIAPASTYSDGIDAAGGCNITVTGNGTLNITNGYYGFYVGSYDVPGGNLTIDGATLNVSGTSAAGIWVNHDISFTDSTVRVIVTNDFYTGLVSNIDGTITVTNSDIQVSAIKAAIHMGNTDESDHSLVLNSGTLTLNSNNGYGIWTEPDVYSSVNGTININGGRLNVISALGVSNIPMSNLTVAEGWGFTTGSSLTDSNVTISPACYATVTVENDGNGSASADKTSAAKGDTVTLTATPNTGYHFKEWQSSDVTVSGDAFTMPEKDVTVKAVFEENTYTVTFDANGGTVTPTSGTTVVGGKLSSLPVPTRSSYSFVGWYTAASGGTKITAEKVYTADTAIYAHWAGPLSFADLPTGVSDITVSEGDEEIGTAIKDAFVLYCKDNIKADGEYAFIDYRFEDGGTFYHTWIVKIQSGIVTAADGGSSNLDGVLYAVNHPVFDWWINGAYSAIHTVTVQNDGNGTASADTSSAAKGDTVTLTATPAAGYHFKEWQSSDVTVSSNTFTMPEKNVTVKAIFEKDAPDHTHVGTLQNGTPATCTAAGVNDYYTCSCGKAFEDATCNIEITDIDVWKAAGGNGYIAPKGHTYGEWTTTKEPTLTEKGMKERTCSACSDKQTEEIPVLIPATYSIIAGANVEWTKDSSDGLTFTSDADFAKFVCVMVDGAEIAATNYTAVSGSTKVTLNAAYLETLNVGTHTMDVVSNDGTASTSFTVKATASTDQTNPTSPQTGDNSHMFLWIALLFVSGGVLVGTTVYRKKKYNAD